jgi:hypothetical protein
MICPICGREARILYYTQKGLPSIGSSLDGCDKCIQMKQVVKVDETCALCKAGLSSRMGSLEYRITELERCLEEQDKHKEIR